jgi:type II secretory pathway component GspD/PulD (secretin)
MLKHLFFIAGVAIGAMASADTGQVVESSERGREEERLISVDFPNEDIRVVLRNVADLYKLNLVVPETLVGRTSVKLRNVTWRQVFDVVLSDHNYTYVEEGNIVRIFPRDSLAPERPESQTSVKDSVWWNWIIGVVVCILVVGHVFLFFGVLQDSPSGGTRFVPRFVWALLVLASGVVALVCYWVIHHSNLRPLSAGQPQGRSDSPRDDITQ